MTISSSLKAAVSYSNELDARLARRIGKHLDSQTQSLAELQETLDAPALPSGLLIPEAPKRRKLTKAFVNQVISQNKIKLKGITAAKRLSLADYVAWVNERGVDINSMFQEALDTPSFVELAAYWRQNGSPCLSPESNA